MPPPEAVLGNALAPLRPTAASCSASRIPPWHEPEPCRFFLAFHRNGNAASLFLKSPCARSSTNKNADKLRQAGADRVISVHDTAAAKMAQIFANPNVEDFIEVVTSRGKELDLAEVQVSPSAPYAGQPLSTSDFSDRGIMIVGIRRATGELLLPPQASDAPAVGDCLIALGKVEAIQSLLQTD